MYYILTKKDCESIFFAPYGDTDVVGVCSGDSDYDTFTSMRLTRKQARALYRMLLNQGYSLYE